MTDIIMERTFETPVAENELQRMLEESGNCFNLYRVEWQESFLAIDGRRMLCRFRSPDAESARTALRSSKGKTKSLWSATVHEAPQPGVANVLVERRFAEPVTLEAIQAAEDAGAWCLENHRVSFVRTFFSLDRKRMICLYRAPDAESVRLAQQQAKMPLCQVWAFRRLQPY